MGSNNKAKAKNIWRMDGAVKWSGYARRLRRPLKVCWRFIVDNMCSCGARGITVNKYKMLMHTVAELLVERGE